MKQVRLSIWLSAMFCLILLVGTAGAEGLTEFADLKEYGSAVFSDVSRGDWYIAGVKTAYEKGIMDGVGGGKFNPGGTVSRAEVVTIAARMHAAYHARVIPAQSGPWYEPYTAYARDNGLLPAGEDADWVAQADRGYIAYVFSKVVDASDLPAVNLKASIPDLDLIPAGYREAAELLYWGGVLTGKAGGYFDSFALATRAEIATIAMRLIEPPERVSSDPKLEERYVAQQMNAMNGAPFCVTKNGYAVIASTVSGHPFIRSFQGKSVSEIVCQGAVEQIAYFGDTLYALSTERVDQERHTYLTKIDLTTRLQQVVVTFKPSSPEMLVTVEQMTCYDKTLYFLVTETRFVDRDVQPTTAVYRLETDGALTRLCAVEDDFSRRIGAFQDKIVFSTIGEIHVYDLKAKTLSTILGDIHTFVLSGNTIIYGDYSGNLVKTALTALDVPKVLVNIDANTYDFVDSINMRNGVLYVADHKGWLCKYENDGTFDRFLYMDIHGYRLGFLENQFFVADSEDNIQYVFGGRIGTLEAPHILSDYFIWSYGGTIPEDAPRISQATASLEQYGTVKLSIVQRMTNLSCEWRSSNSKVATVSDSGLVTGREPGEAVITAYFNASGQRLTCVVTVSKSSGDAEAPPDAPPEKLNAQQIYAKCSPAVFYIEARHEDGRVSSGSGFFIDGRGTAVTNYHVVDGADYLLAYLPDGKSAWIRVLATDETNDIAILSIYIADYETPYLELGDASVVAGGQTVYAIGSPLGLDNTISNGLISNPRRERGNGHYWIQISVPISHGSSGGALIDEYGRVIGITSAGIDEAQNLNFAIPINDILPLIP